MTHNPFELLGLPPKYTISKDTLDQAYFQSQLKWHPDRFRHLSHEDREAARKTSETLNDAYQQLRSPISRGWAMLEHLKVPTPQPSPKLLMDAMEWREAIEDGVEDREDILSQLDAELKTALDGISQKFEMEDYASIPELLHRCTYIEKTLERA